MSEANVLSARKELKEPVNFHTVEKRHARACWNPLAEQKVPLPFLPSFELRFSFFSFFFFACSAFYYSFCCLSPFSLPPPLFTLATRGYWSFSNLIFAHSGDAEKHLRAIKDRRWKGANCGLKKKERERERKLTGEARNRKGERVCIWPQNDRETVNVTVERSLWEVKCRDARIDVSKFFNRTSVSSVTLYCINNIWIMRTTIQVIYFLF